MKAEQRIFYLVVVLLTGIDMAMMIGLFWSSLQNTGFPLTLGLVLCFSVLLPFALQRIRQRRGRGNGVSFRKMLVLRFVGYMLVLAAASLDALRSIIGFIAVALIMGVLGYFTTSALEALNTRFTFIARTTSERAARWMQTAIQLGAFGGAALGGLLLERLGINPFVISLCGLGIISALAAVLLAVGDAGTTAVAGLDGDETQRESSGSNLDARILKGLSITLGMIGFHIGAFNTLTPVVYQSLNHWTAADFGMASASAGIGAFLAATLPRARVPDYVVAAGIVAMDMLLVFAKSPSISIAACFGIGYGINHLRIGLRKRLIELAAGPQDADHIASMSAFHYLLMQSAAPLLLSVLVSVHLLGLQAAPWLFVIVPLVLLGCLYALPRLTGSSRSEIADIG